MNGLGIVMILVGSLFGGFGFVDIMHGLVGPAVLMGGISVLFIAGGLLVADV